MLMLYILGILRMEEEAFLNYICMTLRKKAYHLRKKIVYTFKCGMAIRFLLI